MSVELHRNIASDKLSATLRESTALSYGSMTITPQHLHAWPEVRGQKARPITRRILNRDKFETDVMSAYNDLAFGDVFMLMAGTGVGKSTMMPHYIVSSTSTSGLVLLPDNLLVFTLESHVQHKISSDWKSNVNARILRTKHLTEPEKGPTIYYSSACDFLGRLASNPMLLQTLGISFIYLDEAHETRPDYYFMRLLVGLDIFKGVKMFFGSATSSTDFNLEIGGVGRTVTPKSEKNFPMSNPSAVPATSPLHHANIKSRVLVFVANDDQIDLWKRYYEDYDVPAIGYGYRSRTSEFNQIRHTASKFPVGVFLSTSNTETGHTPDVNAVVCCGYTSDVVYDMAKFKVTVIIRPVTQSERVQRCGRVGRFQAGIAYYNDIPVSQPADELAPEVAIYVYLWAQVFNIDVRNPQISEFVNVFEEMSRPVAAMYLASRIPPLLLVPYMAPDGFYKNWGKALNQVLFRPVGIESQQDNQVSVSRWTQESTGSADYVSRPDVYSVRISFPQSWSILPYLAWRSFKEKSFLKEYDPMSSGASVISAIDDTKPIQKPLRRGSTLKHRPSTKTRISDDNIDRSFTNPTYHQINAALSSRMTMYSDDNEIPIPEVPPMPSIKIPIRSILKSNPASPIRPQMSQEKLEEIQEWSGSLRRHSGGKSHASRSSDDRDEIELKKVDPVKYRRYKFYPIDPATFRAYHESEKVSERDHNRVDNLLEGKRNFYSLHAASDSRHATQSDYFLSVLRVHNSAVVAQLQASANAASPTGFRKFFLGSLSDRLTALDTRILATAKLLQACALESFFVGVDSRSFHAGSDPFVVTDSPIYDNDESVASVSLAFGDEHVSTSIIPLLCRAAKPVLMRGRVYANVWVSGIFGFSVLHPFLDGDGDRMDVSHLGAVVASDEEQDFLVFKTNISNPKVPIFRRCNQSEAVYIIAVDSTKKVAVLGVFELRVHNDIYLLDKILESGYSGSLIVSVSDGSVLGLYVGYYATLQNVEYSRVVPSTVFAQYC